MFLVREVMQCRPGKVRDMVDKFKRLGGVMQKMGFEPFRIATDVSGERFWTVVLESKVNDLAEFLAMEQKVMASEEAGKAMAGYHELVANGRREIYRLEN